MSFKGIAKLSSSDPIGRNCVVGGIVGLLAGSFIGNSELKTIGYFLLVIGIGYTLYMIGLKQR